MIKKSDITIVYKRITARRRLFEERHFAQADVARGVEGGNRTEVGVPLLAYLSQAGRSVSRPAQCGGLRTEGGTHMVDEFAVNGVLVGESDFSNKDRHGKQTPFTGRTGGTPVGVVPSSTVYSIP